MFLVRIELHCYTVLYCIIIVVIINIVITIIILIVYIYIYVLYIISRVYLTEMSSRQSRGGSILRLQVSEVEVMKRRQGGRCLMKARVRFFVQEISNHHCHVCVGFLVWCVLCCVVYLAFPW